MKTPTAAAAKRLTEANLVALGVEHLAKLLLELAASQPALKRRLRMELAAAIGAAELAQEIDKRISTLATSKARVSWRKRGEFITDLEVLRAMIAEVLGDLDPDIALARALAFIGLAASLSWRVKDPKAEMAAVFDRAAQDVGVLAGRCTQPPDELAAALGVAMEDDISRWMSWIDLAEQGVSQPVAALLLADISSTSARRTADRQQIIRRLADIAGDVDAYIASTPVADRTEPSVGAEIAMRLLAADRVAEAAAALQASDPRTSTKKRFSWGSTVVGALDANFDWESAYIETLQRQDPEAADVARWASFERTLSAHRLRDIVSRLDDFDDVVAMDKAFAHAARHPDFMRGLAFLMDWPALPEAARMTTARADEVKGTSSQLEGWASRLRARQPEAARILLEAAAKAAAREGQSLEVIEALRLEAAELV